MIKRKSPIYYLGNKYRLLSDIIPKMPKNIKTFYDVFGGSGTVSANMVSRAEKVIYNEFSPWVFNLFNFYQNTDPVQLDKWTQEQIEKFDLQTEIPFEKLTQEQKDSAKEKYNTMREHFYNDPVLRKDPQAHHLQMQFSFCNRITFNDDGFMKESFGSRFYSRQSVVPNHYNIYNKGIETINGSFEDLMNIEFDKDDFLYFDPPYYNTNAEYNKVWTWELEMKLLNWLDELTAKGIKWSLSNVIKHKGKHNTHLVEWYTKNGYTTFMPEIIYNMQGNTGAKNVDYDDDHSQEVLVMNYDPLKESDYSEQIALF